MIKNITCLAFMILFLAGALPGQAGASDYQQGVRDFNSLMQNENRAQYRSHWQDIAGTFQKVYQADPGGEDAPKALFYLGRTFEELGKRSFLKSDFEKAENYYVQMMHAFPNHSMAGDAQFRKAGIYLNHYKDSAQAYIEYLRVVYNFPDADSRSKAQEILRELDQANLEKIRQARGDSPAPKPESETVRQTPALESWTISDEPVRQSVSLSPPPQVPETRQAGSTSGKSSLLNIRHWSNDEYTRVVLDLDSRTEYYHKLLKPDPDLGTPHRLFIDLDHTLVSPDSPGEEKVADGILSRIRSAQFTREKSRVVLDIDDLDDFRVFALENPYRIVVDVYAPEKRRMIGTSTSAPHLTIDPGSRELTEKSLVEQLGLKVKTIMLDPGHGGKDPGAVFNGKHEKDIVLKMSRVLGKMLEEKGFEVLYTRTTDVFVPLEERTALANSKKVDLFISLHANAHRNRNVRGFEVYYLNFAQTEDAMRVAARENAVSTQKISDLQYILTDLMLSSKINESRDLAGKIHGITIDHVRSRHSGIRDNGIRQAPFYVLMGARMPAILVEMGYMTNEQDMKLLLSDDFLRSMAGGLTQGILAYKDKIEQFARLD